MPNAATIRTHPLSIIIGFHEEDEMTPSLDFHSVVLYALSDVGEASLAFIARHVVHRNTSIKFYFQSFNHPHDGLETTTTKSVWRSLTSSIEDNIIIELKMFIFFILFFNWDFPSNSSLTELGRERERKPPTKTKQKINLCFM